MSKKCWEGKQGRVERAGKIGKEEERVLGCEKENQE